MAGRGGSAEGRGQDLVVRGYTPPVWGKHTAGVRKPLEERRELAGRRRRLPGRRERCIVPRRHELAGRRQRVVGRRQRVAVRENNRKASLSDASPFTNCGKVACYGLIVC